MTPTTFKDERKLPFLNTEGADKPLRSPVPPEVLERARISRLSRIRKPSPDHCDRPRTPRHLAKGRP